MNSLPKDIENIIIDYKNQMERLEHRKKFNKVLIYIDNIDYDVFNSRTGISSPNFLSSVYSTDGVSSDLSTSIGLKYPGERYIYTTYRYGYPFGNRDRKRLEVMRSIQVKNHVIDARYKTLF